jgi:hypothetical protein
MPCAKSSRGQEQCRQSWRIPRKSRDDRKANPKTNLKSDREAARLHGGALLSFSSEDMIPDHSGPLSNDRICLSPAVP